MFQVGDSDQKLAEGISLYSVASDNYGKPSILGPLIRVSIKHALFSSSNLFFKFICPAMLYAAYNLSTFSIFLLFVNRSMLKVANALCLPKLSVMQID